MFAAVPSEQLGELANWSYSAALFSAAAGPIASPTPTRTFTQSTISAALYGLVAAKRRGANRDAALVNVLAFFAWWAGGQTFAARIRRSAAQIARADHEAITNATRVAATRERNRIHDELHAGAHRALTEIRALLLVNRPEARVRAAREAIRVRHGLRDETEPADAFTERLDQLAMLAAESGLRVDILCELAGSRPPEAAKPLLAATNMVLSQLPSTGGTSHAIVRASDSSGQLVVTVRYRGTDVSESERELLRRALGEHCQVAISSTNEPGIRVTLRAPR